MAIRRIKIVFTTIPLIIIKNIHKEFERIVAEPLEDCTIGLVDSFNLFHWQCAIMGPEQTPYEGGIFILDIQFPLDYPFKPPKVHFVTKIYHMNICSKTGKICRSILDESWAPSFTSRHLLLCLSNTFTDPNPDKNSVLEEEAALLYKTNRSQYDNNIREWTKKYAQ